MKKIFYYVSALLLAGALSWSCSDDDNDGGDGGNGKGGIVLDKDTQTEQVVYANDKSGKNEGIKFTAQGPWKAEVKEVSTKADAAAAPTVDWLALSQYSGDKAGDYTITLTLKQNFTGKTRKAEIRIICGDTVITITIEQKAEKEDGKKLRRVKSVIYRETYGDGYKEVTHENDFEQTYTYSYDEQGRVARVEVKADASATESETDTYRFDYHIVGEITVDHHREYYYVDGSGQKHEGSSDEKYFLTLNEQGNVVRIKESDDENCDVQIGYTADGRLAKLWEENDKDGYSWYEKFYYTDGLLTKGEFWERYSSDSTEIQEFDANVLYPNRYPSNGTNIDFNAFVFAIGADNVEEILYQIGLFGKGSDCLMEIGGYNDESDWATRVPVYTEPNKVHKYTKKYIKWPEEEIALPMKYEFDGDKFVTGFSYADTYELWEHKYEDHVGNVRENPDDPNSPYEFERKTIYNKLLRSEKNTYSYTVVYE